MAHWSDDLPMRRLEIEDISDCEACTKRESGLLKMFSEFKVKSLGPVVCRECGREYELYVPE